MSTVPVLAAEDLHVWFELAGGGELHAVQGASFELARGERMGLVGESGCGKTGPPARSSATRSIRTRRR